MRKLVMAGVCLVIVAGLGLAAWYGNAHKAEREQAVDDYISKEASTVVCESDHWNRAGITEAGHARDAWIVKINAELDSQGIWFDPMGCDATTARMLPSDKCSRASLHDAAKSVGARFAALGFKRMTCSELGPEIDLQ